MMTNATNLDAIVNGIRLRYSVEGEGPALLLWHGFLETSRTWDQIKPLLIRSFTVIAPDMRGYGDSDKPDHGYDAQSLMNDFRELTRQLGFERLGIVAHDMGAPPALLWCATFPEEVSHLVYLDEPVLTNASLSSLFQFTPEAAKNGGLWWWQFSLAGDMPERLIRSHEQAFLEWFYENYRFRQDPMTELLEEYLRTFAGLSGTGGALGCYRAIFTSIKQTERALVERVQTPILALGGQHSMGDHVREMLSKVAENVTGGIVQECGHFIQNEQPDYLVEQIHAFVGR